LTHCRIFLRLLGLTSRHCLPPLHTRHVPLCMRIMYLPCSLLRATARNAKRVLGIVIQSVCLSVRIQSGNIWSDIIDHLPNYCLQQQQKEEPSLVRLFSTTILNNLNRKLEVLIEMKYMTVLLLILQLRTFNRKLNVLLKIALNSSDYHVK